ncbi:MAG: hypothetical protein U0941_14995 [Planctomycetaceae bacterium]
MKSKSDGFQTLQIDLMPLVSNSPASKEKECPEATDPRGAKDSIASGAIGRLDINGLYRIRAELSPIINHQWSVPFASMRLAVVTLRSGRRQLMLLLSL